MTQQRLQLTWYNKDKALIPTETGKYGYTWVDPVDPRYCETRTLVIDEYVEGHQTAKTDDFDYSERADFEPQTDNLLIVGESGDALEALTRVPELAKKYVGKVKLIYIDPPFNTAQTFASYEDNLEHSIWLTMMRDRLIHLKKLLSDDGSIWVHLDDVEVHRMRLLMDEIFGSDCFISQLVWQKRTTRENRAAVSANHDHILLYSPAKKVGWRDVRNRLQRGTELANPDSDLRGPWSSIPFTAPGWRPNQMYEIVNPHGEILVPPKGRCWGAVRSTFDSYVADNRVYFPRDGHGRPRIKQFANEAKGLVPETLWLSNEVGENDNAKKHLLKLFHSSKTVFDTPKPEQLLERVIHIGSNPGDIVLDVFAGSGTTAAVAQKMGRRWVTCELLKSTFATFTKPRLEKVVLGEDPGGITRTVGKRVEAAGVELPQGVSPEDAVKFTSVLNKLIADDPELKKSAEVMALKAASKTQHTKTVINWRGGGGFHVAHLSPACFDYDETLDRVILTEHAYGQQLIKSVSANLGFTLLHPDDDHIFDGQRGKALLKVMDGLATTDVVDSLVSELQPGETLVLAATSVMDGVRQHLRKARKGSLVVAIPDDMFNYSKGAE
ncbi:MAG: site-specific DNA-methyltransferase [Ancrocorticia sp.]